MPKVFLLNELIGLLTKARFDVGWTDPKGGEPLLYCPSVVHSYYAKNITNFKTVLNAGKR